jgi:hypothetical protein
MRVCERKDNCLHNNGFSLFELCEATDVKVHTLLLHHVAPVTWPGFPCAMCGMWEQVSLRNGFFKESAYLAI